MSLKLITTEKFGELDCNFYRNGNDEILLTREQIGTALEYDNPREAIKKIHKHHKERLDELSIMTKLDKGGYQLDPSFQGGLQNTTLYTTKGVMEICRWSRQDKANLFMDFVWEVMDRLMHNETPFNNTNNELINQLLAQNQTMMQSMMESQNTMITLLTNITSTLPRQYKPPFTRWMDKTFKQVDTIAEAKNLSRKQMLHQLYNELQDTYDIDLNEYAEEYCYTHGLQNTGIYTLNTIGASSQLKPLFNLVIDTNVEQCCLVSTYG